MGDCVVEELIYRDGCDHVSALILSNAGNVDHCNDACPRRTGADPFHDRPSWTAPYPAAQFDVGER